MNFNGYKETVIVSFQAITILDLNLETWQLSLNIFGNYCSAVLKIEIEGWNLYAASNFGHLQRLWRKFDIRGHWPSFWPPKPTVKNQ